MALYTPSVLDGLRRMKYVPFEFLCLQLTKSAVATSAWRSQYVRHWQSTPAVESFLRIRQRLIFQSQEFDSAYAAKSCFASLRMFS
jgi:hypothetical protein